LVSSVHQPVVELHHIHVGFKSQNKMIKILQNISLEIYPGEIITVIGESGCGKSTLGKVCLGVLKPLKGSIFYDGEYIWDSNFKWTKELRLMVQVIYQDPFASLNPVKTIYEILKAPIEFHKVVPKKQIKDFIIELLTSVELTPSANFLNKYPFQLSGGQRQRVSIARAMILKPKLIIADEPISGVDASSRLNILKIMKNLNKEHNIAFLYITHDLATAKYFAKHGRILVMYLGRIVETGVVSECIDNPRHPYLQALLSAITFSLSEKEKKIKLKSFELPNLLELPEGCVFHPRCAYATDICLQKEPYLTACEDNPSHLVACHNIEKIPLFNKT